MPTKSDPRIDAYIAAAAPFAPPILRHLRKLVHAACPEVVETLKWSSPSFVLEGKILCFMAAFKAHAAFGFWHKGMEQIIARDRGPIESAMGLLGRLTALSDLPDDKTIIGYVRTAMELTRSAQSTRPRPKAKKSPTVPVDLSRALQASPKSAATWSGLPPGCRREYLEWITEAKRPETRATRLATTVAWLAEGKRRNWKYEKC